VDFRQRIIQHIEESIALKHQLLESCIDAIASCVEHVVDSLRNNGKIIFCGNGGSAADSQHLAAELVIRLRSTFNRPAIPALALTVNTSILTAAANDFGFDQVFVRQIEALANSRDLLIVLSTSGESKNIIEAVKLARQKKIFIIGFLGGSGGQLAQLVNLPLIIPSNTTARIQEAHIMIGHIICELVETELQNS